MKLDVRKTWSKDFEGREFPLRDVVGFLTSNAPFIGLVTLLLSTAVVAISLLIPQQYSKQITLDATTVPTSLLSELGQPPVFDDVQLGNLTVGYLRNTKLDGVSVSPIYNTTTRQVDTALQSYNREVLDDAVPTLVRSMEEGFRDAYEEPLDNLLKVRVNRLEREIETNRSAAQVLEREVGGLDGADPRTLARLEGFESARGATLAEIARSEAEIRDLQETRENLPRLADETVAAKVLSESEASQSRSLVPVVALAIMLGLIGAVVASIVRAVLRGVA